MILRNFIKSTLWVVFLSSSWHDCVYIYIFFIYIDVFIYIHTPTPPKYKKDSWWDPQQHRLSEHSVFPNTSHTHWKRCLLVATTVLTRFSDLSFKYTHSMTFTFPQWRKKKKVWELVIYGFLFFLFYILPFSFQTLETFLHYPRCPMMCGWAQQKQTEKHI